MLLNKVSSFIFVMIISLAGMSQAQVAASDAKSPAPAGSTKQVKKNEGAVESAPNANRKKVSLNFEDELVEGQYDAPEVLLMNSRKHIKYQDLFNTRNNYLDEIETNRGIFKGKRGQ